MGILEQCAKNGARGIPWQDVHRPRGCAVPQSFVTEQQIKYLTLLSEKFPTCQAVFTEVINLEAILNLPKATEHFISDVHGDFEQFDHIINNCSGVIRERVRAVFRHRLTPSEQAELCTLVYYPDEKLRRIIEMKQDTPSWYRASLGMLIELARYLSDAYTRSKVRKAMPVAYAYIIDELLHASPGEQADRAAYHGRIIESIIETGSAGHFIRSLASLIKRLAVDHVHVVGDIYDRGAHGDAIVDRLLRYHSLDIQWGNHDICWMGAAAGSAVCVATVVRNNVHYDTLDILEGSYGIQLRELALFAEKTYRDGESLSPSEKAISVIMFKLMGQVIARRPEFDMGDRLLLEHVNAERGTVRIGGHEYELTTKDFPTLDLKHPYELTEDEQRVVTSLVDSFTNSRRLRRHVDFLYEHGSVYLAYNGNLLFHGCVPMRKDGSFRPIRVGDRHIAGRAYLDACDRIARRAWHDHSEETLDWMWYMWCGLSSPLAGRKVKTFERTFVKDRSTWVEDQDPYFELACRPDVCQHVLEEFGLYGEGGHIINGHTPVSKASGETPIRGAGKRLVIDGGFCRAYHSKTGIAGYTLIVDANGMRIKAHRPYDEIGDVVADRGDIYSDDDQLEVNPRPLKVADTDTGAHIRAQIDDLTALLDAYRNGELPERGDAA